MNWIQSMSKCTGPAVNAGPFTHEARRYCKGDEGWTAWQPCTAQQAAQREKDETFQVRLRRLPNTNSGTPSVG